MSSIQHLPAAEELVRRAVEATRACGVNLSEWRGDHDLTSPINGAASTPSRGSAPRPSTTAAERAHAAYLEWRTVPAPVRGALVQRFGQLLVEHKEDLATLISLEVGKISSEARGEVQEMIDICDFAVGLSRQLYGRTMPSERPGHRLMETWHPLGVVGVIRPSTSRPPCGPGTPRSPWSAVTPWSGSPRSSLRSPPPRALRCSSVRSPNAGAPANVKPARRRRPPTSGRPSIDSAEASPLVSATGSTRMGERSVPRVANRFGRAILELGGNNAAIVTPSADLDLVARGVVFAAAGTAGQRCTTDAPGHRPPGRRRRAVDTDLPRPTAGSRSATRSPKAPSSGPLIDGSAHDAMAAALDKAAEQGGEVARRRRTRCSSSPPSAYYVQPAIVRMPAQTDIVERGDLRPDPLRADLRHVRRGDRAATTTSRRACRRDLHPGPAEAELFIGRRRIGLRHRQRQHRHVRRRDRRRVRRREDDRRRPRVRLRRLARLHAPRHQHHQLLPRAAAGAGRRLRRLTCTPKNRTRSSEDCSTRSTSGARRRSSASPTAAPACAASWSSTTPRAAWARAAPGCATTLTVAEVARLARTMTWKWAAVDLFYGGRQGRHLLRPRLPRQGSGPSCLRPCTAQRGARGVRLRPRHGAHREGRRHHPRRGRQRLCGRDCREPSAACRTTSWA